ncbi:cell wall / vacuolar inhibitor of fructosidase 2-like [Salvia miltiorrhiza]|uniref:cell wall / vacuolar inhibitor of fructosidase 2-like n=1 Tax=Salvia miltiorrhiza TaxID=226208 RepID=UPI0025ACC6D4|nr:cell wall / vacuolar inhibitor of fructosidase 2-like [Salvia miltiorrhiza]
MRYSWFMLLFTISLSLRPRTSSSADLIQQTCKSTKYYDLCVSSLKSDSSSPKAGDAKGLALIMVRLGVANATATNAYLLSAAANSTSAKKAIKECADKYAFASEALKSSLQDLSDELYDYAYMHVMAAADYPDGCRNAFKRSPGLLYPPEMAHREDGLKRICDVVLGIIDSLA